MQFTRIRRDGNPTLLSPDGKRIYFYGAGLEPSYGARDDGGRSATGTDFDRSAGFSSDPSMDTGSAFPATVEDFAPVETIIEKDLLFLGTSDSLAWTPIDASDPWPTIPVSSDFDPLSGPLSRVRHKRRGLAICSGDGSSIAVMRCEASEDSMSTTATDNGADSDDVYQPLRQGLSFAIGGGQIGWPGGGAAASVAWGTGAALPLPDVFYAAAGASAPLSAEAPPAADAIMPAPDLEIPDGSVDAGEGADPFTIAQLAGALPSGPLASSVPEVPLPAMLMIGFGGLALVRRRRLFSPARLA